MVWIHGGCFVSGSASAGEYDGEYLASLHDVVVVSVQYRLAAFGWLADDLLRPRDPKGSTGNYGLLDNIAALRWIHSNIGAFGGEPGRVTIFGESSGAGSVGQLLGMPDAWPYFHQAIMESGTAPAWTYMDVKSAYGSFDKVKTASACDSASDVVACLLNADPGAIMGAVYTVPCRDGCNWAPVIDGVAVRGRTMELATAGLLRPNTPIIAGFNLNDGAMFVPGYPLEMGIMTDSVLQAYFAKRFGIERVQTLLDTFPVPGVASPWWLSRYFSSAQACETDFSYACTAQWFTTVASSSANGSSQAFIYQFSELTSDGATLVLHGDEIYYVFGTLQNPSHQQASVVSMTMAYWTNCAKTGDPNGGQLQKWPAWDKSGGLFNIRAQPSIDYVPHDTYNGCKFFHDNWDYYGGCLPENPGVLPEAAAASLEEVMI